MNLGNDISQLRKLRQWDGALLECVSGRGYRSYDEGEN